MSYNVTEQLINDKQTFINAGISELQFSHRVDVSSNGNPFLEYCYTNASGKRAYKTEWPVNDPKPFGERSEGQKKYILDRIAKVKENTGADISVEEVIKQMHSWDIDSQMKRILYVAKKFVTAEELIGDFANFEGFIRFVSDKIGGTEETDEKGKTRRARSEALRVKLVWDNQDKFITTPSKVIDSEPWSERVDAVSTEESEITILPTDKIVRSSNGYDSGTRAPQTSSPLSSPATAKEDMPF